MSENPNVEFNEWVRERAVDAGYPVHIPRSGAYGHLARDMGVHTATAARILNGRVPAYRQWDAWAKVLKVSYEEFEERAGSVLREERRRNRLARDRAPGQG